MDFTGVRIENIADGDSDDDVMSKAWIESYLASQAAILSAASYSRGLNTQTHSSSGTLTLNFSTHSNIKVQVSADVTSIATSNLTNLYDVGDFAIVLFENTHLTNDIDVDLTSLDWYGDDTADTAARILRPGDILRISLWSDNWGGSYVFVDSTTHVIGDGSASGPVPSISSQPANQTVNDPSTATFTATGSGSTTWKAYQGLLGSGAEVGSGSGDSASYTTGATTDGGSLDGATFYFEFTNANGTTSTALASLTVNAPASMPSVRGHIFTAAGGTNLAALASGMSTAPVNGDRIIAIINSAGPSPAPTINYTDGGGSTILAYEGSGWRPRIRILDMGIYAGETSWTVGSDVTHRVAVLALNGGSNYVVGTPVASGTTNDISAITNLADSLGITITCSNWDAGDDSTFTTIPAGHTLIGQSAGAGNNQILLTEIDLASAGTYDPGSVSTGPTGLGNLAGVAVAIS